MSNRQIERGFKSILGLSPLEYQRITRFQEALKHLQSHSLAQVAALAGYYDQSHMRKDFKKMSPWTPINSTSYISGLLPFQESR